MCGGRKRLEGENQAITLTQNSLLPPSSSSPASQPSQHSLKKMATQFAERLTCVWGLFGCMWVSCVLCMLHVCASGEVGREGDNVQRGGESRRYEGGGGGAQMGGWVSQDPERRAHGHV